MSVAPNYMTLPEDAPVSTGNRVYGAAFLLLLWAGCLFVLARYYHVLDVYEIAILIGATSGATWLTQRFNALRTLILVVAALSLSAIALYHGDLGRAQQDFWLKYFLASQSAVMWMSALFVMATVSYFIHLFSRSDFAGEVGSGLTWTAVTAGFTGLMVRWHESYLMSPDIGHIPVSNLYEVFVLFCLITSLIYLHYERTYRTRSLGGFVLLVISAAVGFLLWYTFDRHASGIEPLVPALNSYWMKIHVPANFIGYGCFSLSAMVGTAYLLRDWRVRVNPNGILATRLPSPDTLNDLMYKAIALGFAFFTIATILGALWAAQAWGGYWSWDPKETWALIVWLNYAAWLHLRISRGWRGNVMAWWAVIGLFVTLFAFLGVNMFLSGLHSYGRL